MARRHRSTVTLVQTLEHQDAEIKNPISNPINTERIYFAGTRQGQQHRQALRVLKKKMQREGVFREMKMRSAYEKPSEKRVREKAEAVRRTRKLARKKLQREGLCRRRRKSPARAEARRSGCTAAAAIFARLPL